MPLRILQANVGRSGPAHDTALQLAHEHGCQLVLVQEPFTFKPLDSDRERTKSHPAYNCHAPPLGWEPRPRVLTYTACSISAYTSPLSPRSNDLLLLCLPDEKLEVLNVYRPPQEGRSGRTPALLQGIPITNRFIAAGDFNATHPSWQSWGNPRGGDAAIAEWAEASGLALLSPPDSATHQLGNVLDLVFSNISTAATNIELHLRTGSDHESLLTTIPSLRGPRRSGRSIAKVPGDRFLPILSAALKSIPTNPTTPPELDELATTIVECVQNAREASDSHTLSGPRGNNWWTEELGRLHRIAKRHARPHSSWQSFHAAVRKAKAAKTAETIANATTPKAVFQLVHWAKDRSQFQPPPLCVPGCAPASSPAERAAIFRDLLIKRASTEGAAPVQGPAPPPLELPCDIRPSDLHEALLNHQSTAPGEDGITTAVLRAGWPALEEPVLALYQQAIALGHFPTPFRSAKVVMIPKPGKRDLTAPSSYRPIALLSCLGKGLERLIARRLAYTTVRSAVTSPTHFGALPKRSATDLVSCLAADLEAALACGESAALLLLDVNGAFDSVVHNLLLNRLRMQGWPLWLLRLVESFIQDRSLAVHLDGHVSAKATLPGGLPQGSPLSPILFLLYAEPLLKREGLQAHDYCYADDLAKLYTARTPRAALNKLQRDLPAVLQHGRDNGLPFSSSKTQVQLFSRSRKHALPTRIDLSKAIPDLPAEAPAAHSRWLGAILDSRLSWRDHVKTWAAKASRIGAHLKRLAGTQRGPPPRPLRTAVQACAVSVATYAAEAWFPGTHGPSGKPNRVKGLVDITNRSIVTACRAAIPAYRTTPSAAILREAGIPPAAVLLSRSRNRHAARIQLLDEKHPLIQRVDAPRPSRFVSTLSCTAASIPQRPRLPLLPRAPKLKGHDPEAGLEAIATAGPSEILLFTDGSRLDNGHVGFGFTAFRGSEHVASGHGALGTQCEVYDAELHAAAMGLAALQRHPDCTFWTRVLVLLDNQSAAQRLASGQPTDRDRDCSVPFFKAQAALEQELLPAFTHPSISVLWIPGHSGIPGNDKADKLAKRGAAAPTPDPPPLPPTPAFLKRLTAETAASEAHAWWAEAAPQSYQNLGIKFPARAPPELSLARPLLSRLVAARSGHGDFADYHERFNHEGARLLCTCLRRKSPIHFFFCPRAKRAWRQANPADRSGGLGPHATIDWLLGTPAGAKRFAAYCLSTAFFSSISY